MAKGFAIHNAPTDHGGFIPSTQVRSSQQGNLFVRAGDGHFCPLCKTWSTVIKSHDHVIFDGKAVAYAGDKLTCGAKLLPQQSHVVGDSGSSSQNTVNNISNLIMNVTSLLSKEIFKAQFKCIDKESNEIIKNRKYFIQRENGEKIYGKTDNEGFSEIIETETREEISIHFYFISPSGEEITMEDLE